MFFTVFFVILSTKSNIVVKNMDIGIINFLNHFLTLEVLVCFLGFILLVVIYLKINPKYILHAYNRLMMWKLHLKKRTVVGNSSCTFSYVERGSSTKEKPSIVLIHGFGSSKYDHFSLIEFLPRDYHVIALDLPGHGETTTPAVDIELTMNMFAHSLDEFVRAVGLDRLKFHLLGMSMGGNIAGLYAAEYPEKIASLILVCPLGVHFEKEHQLETIGPREINTIEDMKQMLDLILYKKIHFPDIFLSGMVQLRLEKEDFLRKLQNAIFAQMNNHSLEKNLHRIHAPVLLLWGKEDRILHVDCVATIKAKLPSPPKKTVVLEQVGHGILVERPRKCSFLIQNFINEVLTDE